ncbi:phage major capsid protein [Nocardia acidivorans]|uniref:phage major capsid protein n=1 Tax=Nocardia acidivorans TaxID=404580 RepID=UPI000AF4F263|nr:phage major capsid protein [Nocardia acidivorans]
MTEIHYRTVDCVRADSDGRTIYGRVVPYGEPAEIRESGVTYTERFAPGAFSRSIAERGGKVRLFAVHETRRLPIGRATELTEQADGLYGSFAVAATREGDDALELVRSGIVDAFSIGFRPIRQRHESGVTVRTEAALIEVSLVGMPAYEGAQIHGVRSADTHARLTALVRSAPNQQQGKTTMNVSDQIYDRLRYMSDKGALTERDRLTGEARDMLRRSEDGGLTADDDTRFGEIERDLEFLNRRIEQRDRLLRMAQNPGYIESGTPWSARQAEAPTQKRQILTRAESFDQWGRDSGHIQRDQEPLSFDRYLRGIAVGDWDGATHERALAEGTQSAGGYLVPTPLAANVIDLARNAMRVIEAGAVTVPMQAQTLRVARLTGEGAPAWRNESAPIAAGDLSFDSVLFTARSLDRLVIISRELFEDSSPAAGNVIAHSFAAQIALELDRVALRGSGTPPEPRGVLNTPGISTTPHGANGTSISNYDWFLDSVAAVRGNNFEPNAHIIAPRTAQSLSKLKNTLGDYLEAPGTLLPLLTTKQVPANLTVGTSSDASEIYTGQWNQLAIGIRTGFEIQFLTERYADNGQYAFIAHMRADVQVLQPGAFAVDTGVRG